MPNKNVLKEGIKEDYEPTFRQVTKLSEQDIQIIMEVLTGDVRAVETLREKTRQLLEVNTDLPPVKFLYTVVKDYSHITANA